MSLNQRASQLAIAGKLFAIHKRLVKIDFLYMTSYFQKLKLDNKSE